MSFGRPANGSPPSTPRVSVVMAFHDARSFLEEAVASVRAQTFPDWELVLVDDGSEDGSRDLADSLVKADGGRLRLVQHGGRRNLGTGASRSLGVSCARGEFLAFLDADDVYLPGRLARHVELLDRHPDVALVQGRVEFWHSWATGDASDDRLETALPLPAGAPIEPPELLVLLLRSRGFTAPAVCSLTMRTEAVRRVGGFEASFRDVYEDQVLLAKLYLEGRALPIEDVLARYRQHADSIVHRLEREGRYVPGWPNPSERAFLEWLQQHVDATGSDSTALRDALRAARRPYQSPWAWRLANLPALSLRAARRAAERVLPPAMVAPVRDLRRRQKEDAAARRARSEADRIGHARDGRPGRGDPP